MDLGIKGKQALVTGGSQGLGRAVALALAQEGCDVATCARRPEPLAAVEREIRALGVRGLAITADLFKAEDCVRVVEETKRGLGGLQILVNNASTNVSVYSQTLAEITDEQLLERVHGKALGGIRVCRAAVPQLTQTGWGRVVFVGGTAARSSSQHVVSGLGNAVIARFAKHLSRELGPKGVTVNVVEPSGMLTERYRPLLEKRAAEAGISVQQAEKEFHRGTLIGRPLLATDVAPLIVYLASESAAGISGQTIAVDGGLLDLVVY